MDAFSDLRMNAMSPSDPESNSTFQTFLVLVDSSCALSRGMACVAVVTPLPFTTFLREVEWIDLIMWSTFIGTTVDSSTFVRLVLLELVSVFFGK